MDSKIRCRRCGEERYVKNGIVRGKQRYKCKGCGCNFTEVTPRGKPAAMKALAVLLYGYGNMTYGMLADIFGVSNVSVYRWIKAACKEIAEPTGAEKSEIVLIDEMWHFVNGKKTRFGSGEPMMSMRVELSPTLSAHVMIEPVNNSLKKLA